MTEQANTARHSRRASRHEGRRIEQLLREHVAVISEEPKICTYKIGFDDTVIAGLVAKDLSPTSVRKIRLEDYGRLRTPTSGNTAQA